MAYDALITYMNDHLSGSVAALELIDHQLKVESTEEARSFFTMLRAEITEDQRTLEHAIEQLGGKPSAARRAVGWLAEKVSRLKMGLDDAASGTIEHFQALEVLVLGIHGKRALWRALAAVTDRVPALAALDLAGLIKRADSQIERVESRRLASAREALADR